MWDVCVAVSYSQSGKLGREIELVMDLSEHAFVVHDRHQLEQFHVQLVGHLLVRRSNAQPISLALPGAHVTGLIKPFEYALNCALADAQAACPC